VSPYKITTEVEGCVERKTRDAFHTDLRNLVKGIIAMIIVSLIIVIAIALVLDERLRRNSVLLTFLFVILVLTGIVGTYLIYAATIQKFRGIDLSDCIINGGRKISVIEHQEKIALNAALCSYK
jgi:ABC-type sugar transport system permease subunit